MYITAIFVKYYCNFQSILHPKVTVGIADIINRCRYCRSDIINIVVETGRHVKGVIGVSYNS